MTKVRMVIIGTAHMHCNEIALYISRRSDAELLAVADLPAEIDEQTDAHYTRAWNRQNIVENYGAKPYDDYIEMLEAEKPDFAFILCENDRKAAVALECAKRGVSMSLEKPMSMTYEEAKIIKAAADAAGVEAVVNWPVVWRPYVNQMQKAVAAKLVGEPLKLEYTNGHTGPLGKGAKHRGVAAQADEMTDETRSRIWWYQQRHGGGVFLDMVCYGALFTCWMLGSDWKAVTAMGMNLATPYADCDDNGAAIVCFEDRMAIMGGTWSTPNRFMASGPSIVCSGGVIYCGRDAEGNPCVKAMDTYGNDVPVPAYDQPDSLTDMVCQYVNHVKTGEPLHAPIRLDMNLDIIALLEAAIRSAQTHREIEAQA